MTYNYCKIVIKNGRYGTKESMTTKLDVFLLNDRITQEEYTELVVLLESVVAA